MLVQGPLRDAVDDVHVPRHIFPGEPGVADGAEDLRQLRGALALLLSVPHIKMLVAFGAEVASGLVVLHPGHRGEEPSAFGARMLKLTHNI